MILGCIADDFTGATDLAALLVRAGVPVSLRIGLPDRPGIGPGEGVEVVAEAGDGAAACREALVTRPDVAIVDLRMPVLDGVAATVRLRADVPDAAVLVLTTYADDESILASLRAGAQWWQARLGQHGATATIADLDAQVLSAVTALPPHRRQAVHDEAAILLTRGLDGLRPYFTRYLPAVVMSVLLTPAQAGVWWNGELAQLVK